jgi:hypothetical protein
VLVCWCAGVLVCWCAGVLVCWCAGVLVCWCAAVLVSCCAVWAGGCWLLPAACCLLACCLLPAACCLLPAASCCLLPAACLPAACWPACLVWWLLSAGLLGCLGWCLLPARLLRLLLPASLLGKRHAHRRRAPTARPRAPRRPRQEHSRARKRGVSPCCAPDAARGGRRTAARALVAAGRARGGFSATSSVPAGCAAAPFPLAVPCRTRLIAWPRHSSPPGWRRQ